MDQALRALRANWDVIKAGLQGYEDMEARNGVEVLEYLVVRWF